MTLQLRTPGRHLGCREKSSWTGDGHVDSRSERLTVEEHLDLRLHQTGEHLFCWVTAEEQGGVREGGMGGAVCKTEVKEEKGRRSVGREDSLTSADRIRRFTVRQFGFNVLSLARRGLKVTTRTHTLRQPITAEMSLCIY